MSKSDAMRAMREARYAGTAAAVPTRRAVSAAHDASATGESGDTAGAPVTKPARAAQKRRTEPKEAERKPASPATAEPTATTGTEHCGHRSMNGRACTREAGHAEKSHRYS